MVHEFVSYKQLMGTAAVCSGQSEISSYSRASSALSSVFEKKETNLERRCDSWTTASLREPSKLPSLAFAPSLRELVMD